MLLSVIAINTVDIYQIEKIYASSVVKLLRLYYRVYMFDFVEE